MAEASGPSEPTVWIDGPDADAAALRPRAVQLMRLLADRPELADIPPPHELSIVLMDDAGIRPLNARWRDVDAATDVLAFPMGEGGVLGDVVISLETAAGRVIEGQWDLIDEVLFLLIHGALHLLGHDHHEVGERAVMEAAEQALWTAMGQPGTLRPPEGEE